MYVSSDIWVWLFCIKSYKFHFWEFMRGKKTDMFDGRVRTRSCLHSDPKWRRVDSNFQVSTCWTSIFSANYRWCSYATLMKLLAFSKGEINEDMSIAQLIVNFLVAAELCSFIGNLSKPRSKYPSFSDNSFHLEWPGLWRIAPNNLMSASHRWNKKRLRVVHMEENRTYGQTYPNQLCETIRFLRCLSQVSVATLDI